MHDYTTASHKSGMQNESVTSNALSIIKTNNRKYLQSSTEKNTHNNNKYNKTKIITAQHRFRALKSKDNANLQQNNKR